MAYNPPTRVVTTQMPLLALVTRTDPTFQRTKYREIEYEFSGKVFLANPYIRGIYNRYSNTYPVGAPYGELDALIQAALEPTVGNPIPGVYQGVATGGWA